MGYRGHINHGVVVFDEHAPLADGQQVTVEPVAPIEKIDPDRFWQKRTMEQLALEQGLGEPRPLEELIGNGASLWDNDADCDAFVHDIHDRRRLGMSP